MHCRPQHVLVLPIIVGTGKCPLLSYVWPRNEMNAHKTGYVLYHISLLNPSSFKRWAASNFPPVPGLEQNALVRRKKTGRLHAQRGEQMRGWSTVKGKNTASSPPHRHTSSVTAPRRDASS